ncbi:hypothetical protein [Streptomyces cucumeris]|uniref:hypothetical protein n=1 Tax=Streptomyces cucumeris TaxID=2962890 RepID=UPI003D74ECEC
MIDTKNEMKKSVDGLDGRVSGLEGELRAAVAAELAEVRDNSLADLKSSQQDAQRGAHNAAKRAGEAAAAVTELRRDVDRLHSGLEELRHDLGEVLALLRATAPTAATVTAAASDHAPSGELGRELAALPGQRPTPEEESAPDPAETSAPADELATASAAESARDDGQPADAATEQPAREVHAPTGAVAQGEQENQAALEAGAQPRDGTAVKTRTPDPFSPAGRVWAIMGAGKVSSATLVCHRDTWDFVAAQVGNHPHFRTPTLEERERGMVAAVVSGRSLVAMLLSLYQVAENGRRKEGGVDELVAYADWAMASQVYRTTADVLNRALHEEGDPVVVTIDSRLPARP